MKRKTLRLVLVAALLTACACADSNCGGCVGKLPAPFPAAPRVYDGTQVRVTDTGFTYIQNNLPAILASLLKNGLVFDIPATNFSYLVVSGTICQTPCPITVTILDSNLSLVSPDKIHIDAHVNVDGTITMDAGVLGHCEFPLALRNKPLSTDATLIVDTVSNFMTFAVADLNVTIDQSEYQIQCPFWYDWLLQWLKGFITDNILNPILNNKLNSTLHDLIAQQTCLPCDFYTGGCPTGSSCNSSSFCEASGKCLVKPLGLVGRLDLGAQLKKVDPGNHATIDLMVTPGQTKQPPQEPFVRANGLEVRVIGGSYADQNACVPNPPPEQIPPTGVAPTMLFGNIIPGIGDPYMVGVSVADMYLDHLLYQIWRSGFFCLAIDSYGVNLITTQTLGLIIPSVGLLADGENLPARIQLFPQGVVSAEVGKGSFNPDSTVAEPILYLFLPDLRMDFWMKIDGRWVMFLSLTQDVQVNLALQFTADNKIIPILDDKSITVSNVRLGSYELLAESPDQIKDLLPQLISMALPQLSGTLGNIQIPPLQGFVLDVKSVQGDVPRSGGKYYEFMSIYANLSFTPPPAPVKTRAQLLSTGAEGALLAVDGPALETQWRLDGGFWSPFQRGPLLRVPGVLLPGNHSLEVRSRLLGNYRTLDPTALQFTFTIGPRRMPVPKVTRVMDAEDKQTLEALEPNPQAGCGTASIGTSLAGLLILALVLRRRR